VGSEALFGIEIGPDGRLWITETATPSVLRLDVACTDC
jgi:streptogramin lyase